jgi:AraC family transcriptional regulator
MEKHYRRAGQRRWHKEGGHQDPQSENQRLTEPDLRLLCQQPWGNYEPVVDSDLDASQYPTKEQVENLEDGEPIHVLPHFIGTSLMGASYFRSIGFDRMREQADVLASDASREVRVASEETIQRVVATLPLRTSCQLNWPGVEVHRYRLTNAPAVESSVPYILVVLPHAEKPYKAEMTIGGKVLTARLDKNCVSIVPPGQVRAVRGPAQPVELTFIFLDPLAVARIARAETGVDFPEIIPQFGIVDPLIRSIGMMLDAELASEHPKPRIYAESLVAALAAQIFARYAVPLVQDMRRLGSHWPALLRSIEFIENNLDRELLLGDMAAVANMSKYHFAKSFRQVMGMPPYQYLVRIRVEKARKLLRDHTMSVEEVASRVGYFNKEHFSKQFLKLVGNTPKNYRDGK